MIVCVLVWCFLSLLSILTFISFFSFLLKKEVIYGVLIDHPFASMLSGCLILSNLLMIISFAFPLKFSCILVILLIFTIKLVLDLDIRNFTKLIMIFSNKLYILLTSSVITFFFVNVPYEKTVDMLTYHIQISRYLHEYGLVKGLALISAQLGHQSIWFALPAPFENILGIYSSLTIGGFSYFLSICQLIQSIQNIRKNKEDVFLASYILLCLTSLNIIVQPTSVEMIIGILTGTSLFFCIKTIIKIHNYEGKENKDDCLPFFWITFTLSLSSLALKLTAAPVFLIGLFLFFYVMKFSKPINLKLYFLRFFIIILFFVLPKTIASALTSGCPLYPSSFLHLEVPWFVGEEFSRNLIRHISAHAKFGTLDYPEYTSWFYLWREKYEGKAVLYCISIFTFLLFSSLFLLKYKILKYYKLYLVPTIPLVIGLLYTFLLAPSARFILPYTVGICALQVFFISHRNVNLSLFIFTLSLSTLEIIDGGVKSTIVNLILLLLLIYYYFLNERHLDFILNLVFLKKIIIQSLYYTVFSLYSSTENPLILPEKASLVRDFKKVEINSITYFCPSDQSTCSYSPLPCYQGKLWFEIPLEEVELIDKEKGIAGGFKRKSYSLE